MTESLLTRAAQFALAGSYTWEAICLATDHEVLRRVMLADFRRVFRSSSRWPDGDGETRCLAFLLLQEEQT